MRLEEFNLPEYYPLYGGKDAVPVERAQITALKPSDLCGRVMELFGIGKPTETRTVSTLGIHGDRLYFEVHVDWNSDRIDSASIKDIKSYRVLH